MTPKASEFDREMMKLEAEIKRLEAEYTMFFNGRLPRLPWETRARVEKLVKQYDRMNLSNTAQKFRFSTIQSRFIAFCELWERSLKAREEGPRGPAGKRPAGGPDMIVHVYPDYRVANAVQESNIHLHNVPMQIAAERGLPALALWLWFIGSAFVSLRPLLDRARQRPLAAAAVAATIAMLTAGLFEYNFGDSEFLMLFLILLTLPFAADREPFRDSAIEP